MNYFEINTNNVYKKKGYYFEILVLYVINLLFRNVAERTKTKYLDHMKNIQKDLHETRYLLEKDTDLKKSQETAYQQLVEERRQLLTR